MISNSLIQIQLFAKQFNNFYLNDIDITICYIGSKSCCGG